MRSKLKAVAPLTMVIAPCSPCPPPMPAPWSKDLIAQQNPCRQLKADVMGSSVGVDKLKRVKVNSANLALNGDTVKMNLSGSLACGRP